MTTTAKPSKLLVNEAAVIEVWRRSIHEWDSFNNEQIIEPGTIRSDVWFIISGARDLMLKNRDVFNHWSDGKSCNSRHKDRIEKDLTRTFPTRKINLHYEDTLRRILTAYAKFDPTIGYTQGMNYIAGFILRQYMEDMPHSYAYPSSDSNINNNIDEYIEKIFKNNNLLKNTNNETNESDDESSIDFEIIPPTNDAFEQSLNTFENNSKELMVEKAFWTFVSVINKVSSLFCDGLPGFHKSVECFQQLCTYNGPNELAVHLRELNVYPIMCTSWFHSLFTYPAMNQNIAKRIWDIFLLTQCDFSIMLKIAYLMVLRHEKELLAMDFMQIIQFCKSEECMIYQKKEDHQLIDRVSKLSITESYLSPIRNLKYSVFQTTVIADDMHRNETKTEIETNTNGVECKNMEEEVPVEEYSTKSDSFSFVKLLFNNSGKKQKENKNENVKNPIKNGIVLKTTNVENSKRNKSWLNMFGFH